MRSWISAMSSFDPVVSLWRDVVAFAILRSLVQKHGFSQPAHRAIEVIATAHGLDCPGSAAMPRLVQGTMRGAREGEIITPWPDNSPRGATRALPHVQTDHRPVDRLPLQTAFSGAFRRHGRPVRPGFLYPGCHSICDETLLGLGAALLGSLKKRKDPPQNGAGR